MKGAVTQALITLRRVASSNESLQQRQCNTAIHPRSHSYRFNFWGAAHSAVLATHMPFRKVSEVIGLLLPTHISHMVIYNHFEKVAEVLDEQDRLRAKNLFEDGVIEHPGTKVS